MLVILILIYASCVRALLHQSEVTSIINADSLSIYNYFDVIIRGIGFIVIFSIIIIIFIYLIYQIKEKCCNETRCCCFRKKWTTLDENDYINA